MSYLITVNVAQLGLPIHIYEPLPRGEGFSKQFGVPVSMSCLPLHVLEGIKTHRKGDRAYLIAKSNLRPKISHYNADELVRDLARLEALNTSRDEYFKDRTLCLTVDRFELSELFLKKTQLAEKGLTASLVLKSVRVMK